MEKRRRNFKKIFITLPLLILIPTVFGMFFAVPEIQAQQIDISELKAKIDQKNKEIESINQEIKKSEQALQTVAAEANTLQNAVKQLDLSRQKLLKDVQLTSNKIESTNLNLSKLEIEIKESEGKIGRNTQSLSEAIKIIDEEGSNSMVEVLLRYDNISSFWDELESLQQFQVSVKESLQSLKSAKELLEVKVEEDKIKKVELEELKSDLSVQKKTVEVNKEQKQNLLTETKNKESEYQKILERNLARKAAFEKELFEYESQLKIVIDPNSIPNPRSGILFWPLDRVYVTQFFGATVDSKRLYVSGTHNGVDFRASMGTNVKSALDGVISHMGNTDEVRGCYSFGRWIVVKHNNGLSTLYSHLSQSTVNVGQAVKSGQTIGYSGGAPGTYGAGYSTGPHLHFGVYATQGLQPQRYQSLTPCSGAYMPLADRKAYLDPISYLPPLQ